jgi:YfiH family protein
MHLLWKGMFPMIEIIVPGIYRHDNIVSGLTLRNQAAYPPHGLSVSATLSFPEEVCLHHRHDVCAHYAIPPDSLYIPQQVHGDTVIEITDTSPPLFEADAMMTCSTNVMLMVKLADCCGIVCYDPVRHVCGVAHAGWRGTEKNIAVRMIEQMQMRYGSSFADMRIWLSPCASGKAYEVGAEVAERFPMSITRDDKGRYFLDIRKENRQRLLSAGIIHDHIESSEECTITDRRFHSYRRDKDKAGRMGCFVKLEHESRDNAEIYD